MHRPSLISLFLFASLPSLGTAAPKLASASGATLANLTAVVSAFRAEVGLGSTGRASIGPGANELRKLHGPDIVVASGMNRRAGLARPEICEVR